MLNKYEISEKLSRFKQDEIIKISTNEMNFFTTLKFLKNKKDIEFLNIIDIYENQEKFIPYCAIVNITIG